MARAYMIFRSKLIERYGALGLAVMFASVVWLVSCAVYIQHTIGWAIVVGLLPHEIGMVLTGVFAPLAFVWLVMAYFGRGDVLIETATAKI